MYAYKSGTIEEKEGNKRRRRKRNVCTDATLWDNEKSSQVHLCCGKEVNNVEQKCQICSTKRVNMVENSTQAYFVDIDGYVDEHLQKRLLECTQETNTTQSGICTQDIIVTPENDCCDIVDKDGMMSSTHEKIVTHKNVCIHDNSCATNGNNIATEDRVVETSCQTDITSANCKITEKSLVPKHFRRNV